MSKSKLTKEDMQALSMSAPVAMSNLSSKYENDCQNYSVDESDIIVLNGTIKNTHQRKKVEVK